MKKRLYGKLIVGYWAFVVVSFILVSTLTSHLAYRYIMQSTSDKLYRESILLAKNYAYEYYASDMTLEDLHDHFSTLGEYLSAQIWIVSPNGKILINSDVPLENLEDAPALESFDIKSFGNSYMQVGSFFD